MKIQLIPYRHFSLYARLSVDQTIDLLQKITAPAPLVYLGWPPKTSKPFEGTVSSTGFTISRAIRYRNSFLPLLNGRFSPTPSGTTITVIMTLHPLVVAVGLLMFMILGQILLSTLASPFDLGLGLLLLVFYLAMMFGFSYEANRAEVQLKQVLGPYLA